MFTGKEKIRVKALCLFENNDLLFVAEYYDTVKNDFIIAQFLKILFKLKNKKL